MEFTPKQQRIAKAACYLAARSFKAESDHYRHAGNAEAAAQYEKQRRETYSLALLIENVGELEHPIDVDLENLAAEIRKPGADLDDLREALAQIMQRAETGEQHAEVCRLEERIAELAAVDGPDSHEELVARFAPPDPGTAAVYKVQS